MKVFRSTRSRILIGAVGAAALVIPFATITGASASTPDPNTPTTVGDGVAAGSLPGAAVFGTTPADTPETVSFILKEQNLPQLEASVERGLTSFSSVGQFARYYGQSPQTITALTGYLRGFGISTQVYADDIDVVATGTAGEFDSALAISQKQYHVPAVPGRHGAKAVPAQTVHGNTQAPKLPYRLAGSILAVLGLTNYSPFVSNTAKVNPAVVKPQALSTNDCLALSGLTSACNTPKDFASRYGLTPLYSRGATGSGQTIGIVTLAALDPGAPEYFWKNIEGLPASSRTVTIDNIDGGPGAPSDIDGTDETDLDVEQSGGVAPGSNVIVYQAPNTDSAYADAFFQAASDNVASSVSSSWGESETAIATAVAAGQETPAYQAVFDEAFLELGAQGQSTFLSSGDEGAYTAIGDIGTTNLSVISAGDSPFATAAGGTTLPLTDTFTGDAGTSTVSVGAERAWGWDYLWQAVATVTGVSLSNAAESNVVGSGGGFSTLEPTPSYQQNVPGTHQFSAVQYLTPTGYTRTNGLTLPTTRNFDPTPSVTRGYGTGRAVPDISTDADPYSGYLLYDPSAPQTGYPVLQGAYGGTSFVAPQLNGSAAVIDSALGHRVGLWNPSIYSLATSRHSPFTPLTTPGTSNDNIYYTGTPGLPYNEATGVGTPNLAQFEAALAGR